MRVGLGGDLSRLESMIHAGRGSRLVQGSVLLGRDRREEGGQKNQRASLLVAGCLYALWVEKESELGGVRDVLYCRDLAGTVGGGTKEGCRIHWELVGGEIRGRGSRELAENEIGGVGEIMGLLEGNQSRGLGRSSMKRI